MSSSFQIFCLISSAVLTSFPKIMGFLPLNSKIAGNRLDFFQNLCYNKKYISNIGGIAVYLGNYQQDSDRFDALTDKWNLFQPEIETAFFDIDMHLWELHSIMSVQSGIHNLIENLQRDFYTLYLFSIMPEELIEALDEDAEETVFEWLERIWEDYLYKVSVMSMKCQDTVEDLEEHMLKDDIPEPRSDCPGSLEKRIRVMKKVQKFMQEELTPYLFEEAVKMEIDMDAVQERIQDYWDENVLSEEEDAPEKEEIPETQELPESEIIFDRSKTLNALKELENLIAGEEE